MLQKYAAMLVTVRVLGPAFWLSLVVATAIAGTPVGAGTLADAVLRLTLLGLAVGSVTFAVSGATGRRQTGIAAGAGVGLAHVPAEHPVSDERDIRPFRYLSLFHYSGGASPLGQGLDAGRGAAPGRVGRAAGDRAHAVRATRHPRGAAPPRAAGTGPVWCAASATGYNCAPSDPIPGTRS